MQASQSDLHRKADIVQALFQFLASISRGGDRENKKGKAIEVARGGSKLGRVDRAHL
jgi:hypothetical protein